MPRLSCRSCGRQIYTVVPLESLFAEERRCPRCGAPLHDDRREGERRLEHRRMNPANDPGPPKPTTQDSAPRTPTPAPEASRSDEAPATDGGERRVEDRRTRQRRGGSTSGRPPARTDETGGGWRD